MAGGEGPNGAVTNVCFGRIDPFTTPSGNDCHLRGSAALDVELTFRIVALGASIGRIATVG